MINKYTPKWAVEGPLDFEYRHYNLLAEIKRLKEDLKAGKLSETLERVDDTLDYIYIKSSESLYDEEITDFEIVGVNLTEFGLEYDNKNEIKQDIMDMLLDEAIELFEDLHSEIREIWREVESSLKYSYVPSRKYLLNDGFIFVITSDNKLRSYYFNKPNFYNSDWRSFKVEPINTIEYTKESYIKQLEDINAVKTEKIIFKVECSKFTQIDGFALDVIKSMIYTTLKRDYSF